MYAAWAIQHQFHVAGALLAGPGGDSRSAPTLPCTLCASALPEHPLEHPLNNPLNTPLCTRTPHLLASLTQVHPSNGRWYYTDKFNNLAPKRYALMNIPFS